MRGGALTALCAAVFGWGAVAWAAERAAPCEGLMHLDATTAVEVGADALQPFERRGDVCTASGPRQLLPAEARVLRVDVARGVLWIEGLERRWEDGETRAVVTWRPGAGIDNPITGAVERASCGGGVRVAAVQRVPAAAPDADFGAGHFRLVVLDVADPGTGAVLHVVDESPAWARKGRRMAWSADCGTLTWRRPGKRGTFEPPAMAVGEGEGEELLVVVNATVQEFRRRGGKVTLVMAVEGVAPIELTPRVPVEGLAVTMSAKAWKALGVEDLQKGRIIQATVRGRGGFGAEQVTLERVVTR